MNTRPKGSPPDLLLALEGAPLRVVQCNAYQERTLATRFSLFGVPTFLLVRDGKVLGKMTRYYGKDYWLGVIRDHLPSPSPPTTPPKDPTPRGDSP